MRDYTGGRELARPSITRFALNFITLQSLLTSKAELRRMFAGREWTTSSNATTTAGVDVKNCIFDEDGFWKLAKEIIEADGEVFIGLYIVIHRLSSDEDSTAATIELKKFNNKEGPIFSGKMAIDARTTIQPDRWWQMFGSTTPKLQKIVIRILSQPSSASGCERSWSMFEHIHSKRGNRLSVQRLNDLVFVHYNLRLKIRHILGADSSPIILEEIDLESEWLIEAVDSVFTEADYEWVDQVDREAEAVAIAEEATRAHSGTGRLTRARTDTDHSGVVREPILHAGAMAQQFSRTYLRHLCRGHRETGYSEAEVAATAELEDDDEA